MKYTAISFALFSAIGASASASSGTTDDQDTIIRNLMNKVDILSAKVEAQDAWRTKLALSLNDVKAAVAPQDKTNVRRNLRQEDEAAVEPLHENVLSDILYDLVYKVEKIKEAVEDVHECLDYDHTTSTCTLGDGSSINSVAIRGGTIHLQSTSTGIGLTSATRFDVSAGTNVEIKADVNTVDAVVGFAYIGTGDGNNNSEAGFKAIDDAAKIFATGRFDVSAGTNVEIKADVNTYDAVDGFAYIGTGNGNNNNDAGFKAINNAAKIYGQGRIDIDTGGSNVELNCGTDKNLCVLNVP